MGVLLSIQTQNTKRFSGGNNPTNQSYKNLAILHFWICRIVFVGLFCRIVTLNTYNLAHSLARTCKCKTTKYQSIQTKKRAVAEDIDYNKFKLKRAPTEPWLKGLSAEIYIAREEKEVESKGKHALHGRKGSSMYMNQGTIFSKQWDHLIACEYVAHCAIRIS